MKFYGTIGYGETKEVRPGIWEEVIEERPYYGDILKNSYRNQTASKVNDDLLLTNQFSIVADHLALEKHSFMRYICYMGTKWKISDVEIQYPRIIISVGGVYNEQEQGTTP